MSTPWRDLLALHLAPGASVPLEQRPAPSPPPTEDRLTAPKTRDELRQWCQKWLNLSLPSQSVCPGHSTPLDYLDYVFFERGEADPVIWACRGGGKTLAGAVATLLDMLFKPGIEIRILAGSESQSQRMYEHLVRMIDARFRDQMIRAGRLGKITKSGFTLANGSRVELLAQSESSVRGTRVQKVRCDEVDLFEPKVWEAVQLTTRSKPGTHRDVRGQIEAFSTLNHPGGVMGGLIKDSSRKVFTWCIWDVIETCGDICRGCNLETDCGGKARQAVGFVPVSDVRTARVRVSERTWRFEMMCDPLAGSRPAFDLTIRNY